MSTTFGVTSDWFRYPEPERIIPKVDSKIQLHAVQKMQDLYMNFPDVSLSARTEARLAKSAITTRSQPSYTGRKPVIRSSLADTLCIDLNIERVLRELNTILHTSYTLENPVVPPILESFILQYDDFGTLYAYLRPYWYDLSTVKHIPEASRRDLEMRQTLVTNKRISDGNVPPRRVWDLCANRVVPYWVVGKAPHAISHAWVSDKERMDVQTPINGYQWPVPMPRDTDLNLVRIEMLASRAEYVWLDVLCLRQAGGKGEDLRKKEWEIDVPTIGAIYRNAGTVHLYFNGLGRAFYRKPDYWQDDRCWFNRAWTLQEHNDGITYSLPAGRGRKHRKFKRQVEERLRLLHPSNPLSDFTAGNIFSILWLMGNRKSTKPLDKIAGLAYLLSPKSIPIHDDTQSEEEAWEALVEVMDEKFVTRLLFLYPEPGIGGKHWRPSWKQATKVQMGYNFISGITGGFVQTVGTDADWCLCACIKSGIVRGLAKTSKKGVPRQGELVVKDDNEALHIFKIFADHGYPIPDSSYTFIGQGCLLPPWKDMGDWDKLTYWVVGWQRWDGKFEKNSVIQMADIDERFKLERLHVIQNDVQVFLC